MVLNYTGNNYNSGDNYNNDDDYNDDDSQTDSIYYTDEANTTKYDIVICEIYNTKKYGELELNNDLINHFITINRYKYFDFQIIYEDILHIQSSNILMRYYSHEHPTIRNYRRIAYRLKYLKPEIAECIYLSDGSCVSIIKTLWIKIIQRTWKKIFSKRKEVIKERSTHKSLRYFEYNGRWPDGCRNLPRINGMLSPIT